MNAIIRVVLIAALACASVVTKVVRDLKEDQNVPTDASEYIQSFRRGEDFVPPSIGVIVDGRPDPAALAVLGRELAVGDAKVRERVIRLLVDMGVRSDPLAPKGAGRDSQSASS